MKMKKSTLAIALAAIFNTSISEAIIIDMNYDGLFTMVDPQNNFFQNKGNGTYYYDPTWGYGLRSQISGTLTYDTASGDGSGTVNPFAFASGGNAVISDFNIQSIGNNLVLGNMNFTWVGSDIPIQTVLDVSGLFSGFNGNISIGDTFNQAWCITNGNCALPGSNNVESIPNALQPNARQFPIGVAPLVTSTFNTTGQNGFGTTLSQLSLGIDDGIGGSPTDNGPFLGSNANFDFTSMTVTNIQPSAVPVPAAFWLFGSGLVALIGFCRRK
jgi:hypothetical protein